MYKSYKVRIYPTTSQLELIEKSFGCSRFVYNYFLGRAVEQYGVDSKSFNRFESNKHLTSVKKEKDWLHEVDSQALTQVLRHLETSFIRFFKKLGNFPQFKSKHRSKATYGSNKVNGIDFESKRINLPKLKWIKYRDNRTFDGTIVEYTISRDTTGKYWCSLLVEDGMATPAKLPYSEDTTLGIDVGIKDFAVTSTGVKFSKPKFDKNREKRIKRWQRRLARRSKTSNRRRRARKRIAVLHQKERNIRLDFIHKTSASIVYDNQVHAVAIEDLNITGMQKNHHLAKAIGEQGWYEFSRQLQYKCDRVGKTLIKIPRFFPSSKRCSACGHTLRELKLSQREWTCPSCGVKHDRDINAANNIKLVGQGMPELTRKESHIKRRKSRLSGGTKDSMNCEVC